MDIEYRLVWDKYLKGNDVIISEEFNCLLFFLFVEAKEITDGDKKGIYWQLIMPLFIDNRDVGFLIHFPFPNDFE